MSAQQHDEVSCAKTFRFELGEDVLGGVSVDGKGPSGAVVEESVRLT